MTNQTNTSSLGYVSFLNLFGIFVSIVLCILFIILGGHTLKYIKAFACKIKIIANKAEDKNVQLKDFNYQTPKRSEAYETMEAIYKNEIKKSRSLQYWMIVRNLIAKYDHILYFPFRDRVLEKYDLLKPKTTFYTLLFICTCCIAWMTTIFLSAILQSSYSNISAIPAGTFIGLTIAIAIISSFLNLIATNRLFRVYLLNLKNAFKVDYGNQFLDMNNRLKEFEPENSMEEDELFMHQNSLGNLEIVQNLEEVKGMNPLLQSNGELTQRTLMLREDTNLNSTRKLLNEDFEKSDRVNQLKQIAEENKDEEEVGEPPLEVKKRRKVRGKAIKDIFELQVGIDGIDDGTDEEKYIYVEDKHAIGDMDLLYNEAEKGENKSNLYTFIIMFIIIALSAMFCCYLNYTFHADLAEAVFYMFIGSFLGDILIVRPLLLMLFALLKFCKAKKDGYKKVEYKDVSQIKQDLDKAIKDMFATRKKIKEEFEKTSNRGGSGDQKHLTVPKSKGLGNESAEHIIGGDYLTQNGFDRNDTSMKQMPNFDVDEREDEEAREVSNRQDDDDRGDGPKGQTGFQSEYHPSDFARPQIELDQKNATGPAHTTQAFNAQIPLLNTLKHALQQKDQADFEYAADKKQLHNDLVDYNLLLLRKIYDAYEERAEKVIRHFRSDNNEVLRKRYMVPIVNPNYDYEKLLQEMQDAGKGMAKEKVEEDEVVLDAQTVAGDLDQQLMEAVLQEASDDLVPHRVDRQKIDKFGNPVDEEKLKNGVAKACPQPAFGQIEHEVEENMEEDDEDARKLSMIESLRRRLANGEQLTAEELALLEQLENERLASLRKRISELQKIGWDNLNDKQRLELLQLQQEALNIELAQIKRKKPPVSAEDLKRIADIEDELKKLKYQELLLKEKMGLLTDDERKLLQQFKDADALTEAERLQKEAEAERLRREAEAEAERLRQETEAEAERLRTESEAEQARLKALQDDEEAKRLLKQAEMDELEALRRKLLNGEITEDELRRLRELEAKYGLESMKDPFEEQKRLNQEFEDQMNMSKISDNDNFSELPPVQVLNNLSKPQSPEQKAAAEEEEQKRLLEEQNKLLQQDKNLSGDQEQQRMSEEQKRLQDEQLLREAEERMKLEELANQEKLLQDQEMHLKKQEEQQRLKQQQIEEDLRLEQERLKEEQKLLVDKQLTDEQRKIEEQKLLEQQQMLEEQKRLAEQEKQLAEQQKLENEQRLLEQQKLIEEERQKLQSQQEERQRLQSPPLNEYRSADSSDDQEERSRLGTREQDRLNQQLKDQFDEDVDFLRAGNPSRLLDNDLAFGHDDLEAPEGAQESIYSHKTTTILDEEKVSFMHIDHLPNQDAASDDSFAEQDMVYYNKDDLTNYSKGLGLNKVKMRNPGQNYFSENDLHEVKEGDHSDNDSLGGRSRMSGMSLDNTSQRRGQGRGHLSHRDLDIQGHEDLIEGRVKVDAWNLNYRGKKKKHRKKKVTQNQQKKMEDLQNIYGVDAKTLAGLSKGRLPRQLLATGKLKGDESMGHQSRFQSEADDPFRSTQNTLMNKMSTPDLRMKQSINDAQSNMFSFGGGFGQTRQGWNEGGGLKKGPLDSRHMGASQMDVRSANQPQFGQKKLTATQQNFSNTRAGRGNTHDLEESKSVNSGNSFNNKFKSGAAKKGQGKAQRRRGSDEDIDSHTESDEAVDDKGALFQKRAGPYDFMGRGATNGINDNDRSESEEGNNQEIPNFDGNEFVFKKRQPGDSALGKSGKAQKGTKKRGSGDELDIADLEAQQMSTGKKKHGPTAQKSTGQKKANGFMRGSSAERDDSEEENLGGQVNFQQRNKRTDYADGLGRVKGNRQDSNSQNRSNNQRGNNSSSKPPLSNRKLRQSQNESPDDNFYGQQYNINGRVHPGVSDKMRLNGTQSELSDNEGRFRGSRLSHNESDGDIFSGSKRHGAGHQDHTMQRSGQNAGRHSDPNLLDPNYNRRNQKRGEGSRGRRAASQSDEEDDCIVGPESNLSSIKKRPRRGNMRDDEDDDQYLLLQKERQIIEDIESDNGSGNLLAKKRKIRKAAQSHNTRDLKSKRLQDMQNERLRKKQREAEAALFAQEDDLEAGHAKLKKKKVKKDMVRKEINYWLDYDSPYAEYLVARFREWSPNPQLARGPSAQKQKKAPLQNKYSEVLNVYSKADAGRQGSSKQNSRSRDRSKGQGAHLAQSSAGMFNIQQQKPSPREQQQPATLFVNDFEEEP